MKMLTFAKRNFKEIIRDKLNIIFGLGFPLIVLLLLSIIQSNIPVELFVIEKLAPGICVFGLSFIALFSGTLIARDRTSALMLRLFTSPMGADGFILGYLLPMIPFAIAQSAVCLGVALLLGLEFTANLFVVIAVLLPAALLFIAIGLLCGTVLNDKQVGGFCGALLTNVSAWLSGIWFDLELVGGAFEKIANALPFAPAVRAAQNAYAGNFSAIMSDLWIVIVYAVALTTIAVIIFTRKMKADQN